jgi:branched-chain amino acid transport system ATP-binding protein
MLILNDLVKAYGGNRAVDGVSCTLERGRITGLIGPNGAGKTTLFNLIAGAVKPTSGRITLDGREIGGLRADQVFQAGLARSFQIPRPFPDMTVLDNVMLAPRGQSGEVFWRNWLRPGVVAAEERAVREKAMHWLEFVGLAGLATQPARVLSGGQRKLLEIARVMVSEPKLVLLDEPGAGVNPALLDTIVDRIASLHAQGVSFLIIEHNMDVVAELCDPVMVMAQGKLLVSGKPADVLRDERVVEAYLGTPA